MDETRAGEGRQTKVCYVQGTYSSLYAPAFHVRTVRSVPLGMKCTYDSQEASSLGNGFSHLTFWMGVLKKLGATIVLLLKT